MNPLILLIRSSAIVAMATELAAAIWGIYSGHWWIALLSLCVMVSTIMIGAVELRAIKERQLADDAEWSRLCAHSPSRPRPDLHHLDPEITRACHRPHSAIKRQP